MFPIGAFWGCKGSVRRGLPDRDLPFAHSRTSRALAPAGVRAVRQTGLNLISMSARPIIKELFERVWINGQRIVAVKPTATSAGLFNP
jgi:hypothetical protein